MSRRGKKSTELQNIDLHMECVDEELSPAQKAYYNKNENDYKEVTSKLEHMIKSCGAELVEQASDQVYVLQMNSTGSMPPLTSLGNLSTNIPNVGNRLQTPASAGGMINIQTKLGTALTQPPAQTGILTRGSGNAHQTGGGTYQLVMDPKLGLVVGALTSQTGQPASQTWQATTQVLQKVTPTPAKQTVLKPSLATPPSRPNLRTPPQRALPKPSPTSTAPMVALPGQGMSALPAPPAPAAPETRRRGRPPNILQAPPPAAAPAASTSRVLPAPTASSSRVLASPTASTSRILPSPTASTSRVLPAPATPVPAPRPAKPTENNAVGGLVAGSAGVKAWKPTVAPVVDLTNDGTSSRPSGSGGGNVPDSREMLFNKLSGKTFPSLVVVARPHLRVKDLPSSAVSQGRTTLDAKVKSVLMFTPTKFTEWLIQQGYVRSEQGCSSHVTPDMQPVKLKLGMYSDVSKFPYSGGYVWISECCPHRFVSVFSGSIFEGAPHPPTILLKLMYHWSAQTNVQNVVQWVKVDNFYVKNFFTNMRSICTSAVHEKYEKMGGARKRVEVGVISLGTTSQDGNMRQVKVEVLGVMEPESRLVRLRAVEPLQDGEKNYKRRFVKILEPLGEWVHKDSIILTDFTVDKGTLHHMGFSSVYQVTVSESNAPPTNNQYSNSNVMEYLRRIVPRMFQNTLSLLSRQIIQQFLDELVWRERWGPVPSQCFDNILLHLSEQTKLDTADSLQTRLSKIASNPFKCWNYRSGLTPRLLAGAAASLAVAQASTVVEPVRSGIDLLPQSIRTIDSPVAGSSRGGSKGPGAKRGRKRVAPAEPTPQPPAKKVAAPQPPGVADDPAALEGYYYGTMAGDPGVIKKEVKWTSYIKCCVCPEQFNNNILLMNHLVVHAQTTDTGVTNLDDPDVCRYCLATFPLAGELEVHVDEVHQSPAPSVPACRICETTFADRDLLVKHMHETHLATELPYECGVCTFRSSVHRDVIDHFYSMHDGGESLQCALCLKVHPAAVHGKPAAAHLAWFHAHMAKHFRGPSGADKCGRCRLAFVPKERALKPHVDKDHVSFKMQPGVRTFQSGGGRQMVMIPADVSTKYQSPSLAKGPKQRALGRLDMTNIGEQNHCAECKGSMLEAGHYINSLKCSKCRFTTSCSKAMPKHMRWFHTKASKATLIEKADLPREMHCVCGFQSRVGNQLAKHMALCERKTAYVTRASARQSTRKTVSAHFPPLVTLEDDSDAAGGDASDRWLKAFAPNRKDEADAADANKKSAAPPSMLNMLGLVRKPSVEDLPAAAQDDDEDIAEDSPTDTNMTQDVKPTVADDDDVDIKVPHEELHLIDEAPGEPFDETLCTDPIADDLASGETAEPTSDETAVADLETAEPVEDVAAVDAGPVTAETVDVDASSVDPPVPESLSVEPVDAPGSDEASSAEPESESVGVKSLVDPSTAVTENVPIEIDASDAEAMEVDEGKGASTDNAMEIN